MSNPSEESYATKPGESQVMGGNKMTEKTKTKSYWTIFACDNNGFWILDRFLYSDNLNHALYDAAKFQVGDFKLYNPESIITVVEWRQ